MTQIGEGIALALLFDEQEKYLRAEVIEVEFPESFKASRQAATITAPHWPAAADGINQTQKPAVLPIGKTSHKVSVKVKITSKGYSGNGKLLGMLQGMQMEGSVSLASGTHRVQVTLQNPPDSLQWIKGEIFWGVDAPDVCVSAGRSAVELFFVFADPAKLPFFAKKGVWVEALRFIFVKAKLTYLKKTAEAVAEVTQTCFALPNHKYETDEGAPGFGGASGTFELKSYMLPATGKVNCYDQTYAVIVFSGALGVVVDGLYLNPFGYIQTVNLVGWGPCNNPFPGKTPIKNYLVVGATDPDRSSFGNHMFCEFSARIYDACAGPAKGTEDRAGYLKETLDTVRPPNPWPAVSGTAGGIITIASARADVRNVT